MPRIKEVYTIDNPYFNDLLIFLHHYRFVNLYKILPKLEYSHEIPINNDIIKKRNKELKKLTEAYKIKYNLQSCSLKPYKFNPMYYMSGLELKQIKNKLNDPYTMLEILSITSPTPDLFKQRYHIRDYEYIENFYNCFKLQKLVFILKHLFKLDDIFNDFKYNRFMYGPYSDKLKSSCDCLSPSEVQTFRININKLKRKTLITEKEIAADEYFSSFDNQSSLSTTEQDQDYISQNKDNIKLKRLLIARPVDILDSKKLGEHFYIQKQSLFVGYFSTDDYIKVRNMLYLELFCSVLYYMVVMNFDEEKIIERLKQVWRFGVDTQLIKPIIDDIKLIQNEIAFIENHHNNNNGHDNDIIKIK